MAQDLFDTLNGLIKLDYDAIQAYRQAMGACKSTVVKENLALFLADHERHVNDLSRIVTAHGGKPAEGRDFKGFFISAFTAITSQGDHSALLAMRGNEELTNRQYASALKTHLSDEARVIVEKNYQDEQRHLAWIKDALDRRIWEKAA